MLRVSFTKVCRQVLGYDLQWGQKSTIVSLRLCMLKCHMGTMAAFSPAITEGLV